jgi:peptidyl-tRNA hydrolase, PTH1 family
MKLIVGLGNPGEKYEKTRHNLGFMALEQFLKDFKSVKETVWENSKKFKSDISQIEWMPKHGDLEKVILAKPKTYMNNSGMAVRIIADFYKIKSEDIWIVNDDIDLPLGILKIRFGGASAGHHGIDSIIEHLKTDKFWRFRMGTGNVSSKLRAQSSELKNVNDFVLGGFRGVESRKVKELIKRTSKALQEALEYDLTRAMNRFNSK